ncbi:MAG: methylenetetrahydrofolate reductase [NAD(P)H] [Treponemataceae bacterium]|nr:MAG: methylenetetrahydrofolate reductase [NAD(P)H] [Treponemataceae bacterium]
MSGTELTPDFMSVTCGAGGTTRKNTANIAAMIQAHNVPALAHFSCIGDSREIVEETALSLKAIHIENVLCLRGDIPLDAASVAGASGAAAPESAFLHASELSLFLRERYPADSLCIGGACYPEKHPESANLDACIDMLKLKLDAGISFFTTQMFFSNELFYDFLEKLRVRGINAPVIAGIMPVTNPAQIEKMLSLSQSFIPPQMNEWLSRYKNNEEDFYKAGIENAVNQIKDLQKNGVAGIHLYSMNKVAVVQDIVNSL